MLDNMPRGTICIEDIELGMTRHLRKTITDRDIELFAEVSTDRNPVHLDEAYAQDTIFQGRIAHGMLSAGFISAVLGTALPGKNTIYLGQELQFKAPVKIGDTVTATVEVLEKIEGKNRLILRTTVTNQDGVLVTDGKATVLKK